jgi:hypothetical protein
VGERLESIHFIFRNDLLFECDSREKSRLHNIPDTVGDIQVDYWVLLILGLKNATMGIAKYSLDDIQYPT